MTIVFSFDDGRSDAFEAAIILSKYNLVGSFHVTTGFVDGTLMTDAFGIHRKPLTIEQLLEMKNKGMEISSHGDRHIMDDEDFAISFNKLQKFGLIGNNVGFSVPNSSFTEKELTKFITQNKEKLSYVRVGRSEKCYSFHSKIHYVLYHIFHNQFSYDTFNKYNVIHNFDKFKINSAVVLDDSKARNIIKFINKHKDDEATLVLMFHSIVDNPTNKWEYSKSEFIKICNYVSNNCVTKTLKEVADEC